MRPASTGPATSRCLTRRLHRPGPGHGTKADTLTCPAHGREILLELPYLGKLHDRHLAPMGVEHPGHAFRDLEADKAARECEAASCFGAHGREGRGELPCGSHPRFAGGHHRDTNGEAPLGGGASTGMYPSRPSRPRATLGGRSVAPVHAALGGGHAASPCSSAAFIRSDSSCGQPISSSAATPAVTCRAVAAAS